jgi:hypothetical protein
MPRIIPEPRYFSIPSIELGAEVLRNRAGGDRRGMSNDGHQIAMAARLRPENAEAVLGVVEGDPLDEAGEYFLS